ncbi:MAG: DNA methyltransferase [Jaaginema sp. PMC 1079.18]|nr:DNA methyltransferase [Jaaginema sp. PMC 1080.18]MEC4849846.1 DNA methyltransferase [Jaaginema sp. PMC 1079.18]MEC4864559.1 DNA methyltransferase [Jaaginema sp. PMC 1078.18]
MAATRESIHQFLNFCDRYISGSERQQGTTFLDKFFVAFGYKSAIEAGATFELPIPKSSYAGNTGYADLWWPDSQAGGILFEIKSRTEKNLNKHYAQVWRYAQVLSEQVNQSVKYCILCNFAEFQIYDFSLQYDTPVDTIQLSELPQRLETFRFMEFTQETPVFRNNQVAITTTEARRMGDLFKLLKQRSSRDGFTELAAQQFVLQCVVTMFAEKKKLLPDGLFLECVTACLEGQSSFEVLSDGLFRHMNQPDKFKNGRFSNVDYFNGGLFAQVHDIELVWEELTILETSAQQDWGKIRPAVFGNIFEATVDEKERHARGIHFTSESDIMKIIYPTITTYWLEKIEVANSKKALQGLRLEIQNYKVLDPACGSGNFLYLAYQELKQIEAILLDKLKEYSDSNQQEMGFVTPLQFYGMDSNPFAVELAKVTLLIARKVAIDKLNLNEAALPLDRLEKNIVCRDALFEPWFTANAIVGNPPFLGGKNIRTELGHQYTKKVYQQFSDVKDSVDFCCYWFRLAHDKLHPEGRAGLVATNSIAQGRSRAASLDYITQNGGYIYDAISSQPWSGEAAVHVSLVNWSKVKPDTFYLDNREVQRINSALTDKVDVSTAFRLNVNQNVCFQGIVPNGKGFLISEEQARIWIEKDSRNQDVLKIYTTGSSLTRNPQGKPDCWIIDFNDLDLETASQYCLPFEHIAATVKPQRNKVRRKESRLYWWKFGEKRPALRQAIEPLSQYFAIPRHSKWFIFLPISARYLPADSTNIIASADFYTLGILTSGVHRQWVEAQKSTLKGDTRYTHSTCFETFPFPQNVTADLVTQIRQITEKLHQYRDRVMVKNNWGITQLYNREFTDSQSQLSQFHTELNLLVLQAYGWRNRDNILENLLELNRKLYQQEQKGETIVGVTQPV